MVYRLTRRARLDVLNIWQHIAEDNEPAADRFATLAIYQPMLAVYKQYGSKWLDDARGGMLAYLARYDEKGGLELLRQGIKEL